MKHYEIKYQLNDNSGYSVTTVVASSASQAREKIKAKLKRPAKNCADS